MGDSAASDLLKVSGDLNLAGTVGLNLSDITTTDVAFDVNDELGNKGRFEFGLNTWEISYNDADGGENFMGEYFGGTDSFVNLTIIPEPSTTANFGGLGLLALPHRRRN